MCDHCGCTPIENHHHPHDHEHDHREDAHRVIDVRQSLLSRNDRLAERNRGMFMARGITALNLMSSPGSGKTALIERTLEYMQGRYRVAVIVGDLATDNDAQRIQNKGAPAVQIQTGTACHLDAHMVHHAIDKLDIKAIDLLFIENVGNLVCPASFDLGEEARIIVMAVTEGEDKPLKYPVIFQDAAVVIVNKMDLAGVVGYRREEALANIHRVAPAAQVIELSARTGEGVDVWCAWLERHVEKNKMAVS